MAAFFREKITPYIDSGTKSLSIKKFDSTLRAVSDWKGEKYGNL